MLAHDGIIEQTVGCPIVSQLEVVSLGKTADGIEAFMDRTAYESNGVMLLGLFELGRAVTNPPSALSFFGAPDLSPLLLGARLLAGGWPSLQGIMLAAFGLALWLLAEIAEATRLMASR